MSVCLIYLRFEIDNSYPLIPEIHYTASKLLKQMETSGAVAKPDILSSTSSADPIDSVNPNVLKGSSNSSKVLEKHRGSREMHEISIETLRLSPIVAGGGDEHLMHISKVKGQPPCKAKSVSRQVSSKSSKESTPDTVLSNTSGERIPLTAFKERSKSVIGVQASLNQIQFFSGNHFVEVTKGILHLYKENKPTTLGEEAERSELICVLAVPTSMTIHDLLQFTAAVKESIEHLRIIRDSKPNQYMVLIKFRNQKTADEFYNNFNGVPFNSIEPEVCHLVYVAKVETVKESDSACLPIAGHTELPTCPVCLERMDESVEGILTILCNHAFHSGCLDKWGDTSCPVCRYCQTPEPVPDNRCFECGNQQDSLWICLICGHIGCGRYVEGHAYKHYCDTQHTYAMQLGLNNRVWDYAGDNYVHRLLQNKSDGKMVEVECNQQQQQQHFNDEKIDAVQLEYTYLLTNQLETQRHYFEEAMNRIEKEAQVQIEEVIEKNIILVEDKETLEAAVSTLRKEKQALEKKVNQISAKLTKATAELQEEKELNKCLRENQVLWTEKLEKSEKQMKAMITDRDQEVKELKEQVRDLMFFLEAQEKIKEATDLSSEEIQSSQITVTSNNPSGATGGKTRKNKKR